MSTLFFCILFSCIKKDTWILFSCSWKAQNIEIFTHSILLYIPKSAYFFFSNHCSWSCYIKDFAAYILFWVLDSSDKVWFTYTHAHRNQHAGETPRLTFIFLYSVRIFCCICLTHLQSHTVSFLLDGLLSSDLHYIHLNANCCATFPSFFKALSFGNVSSRLKACLLPLSFLFVKIACSILLFNIVSHITFIYYCCLEYLATHSFPQYTCYRLQ